VSADPAAVTTPHKLADGPGAVAIVLIFGLLGSLLAAVLIPFIGGLTLTAGMTASLMCWLITRPIQKRCR
jgi:hypothetical protein